MRKDVAICKNWVLSLLISGARQVLWNTPLCLLFWYPIMLFQSLSLQLIWWLGASRWKHSFWRWLVFSSAPSHDSKAALASLRIERHEIYLNHAIWILRYFQEMRLKIPPIMSEYVKIVRPPSINSLTPVQNTTNFQWRVMINTLRI